MGQAIRRIKIAYWQRNGLCLWTKRLEGRDRFIFPRDIAGETVTIRGAQLEELLAGFDVWRQAHRELQIRLMHMVCDNPRMLESHLEARTETMEGSVRIALLQSEIEQLRRRDTEREAELAARERRIRVLEKALRVLQTDRFGASREKLTVAPGQSELFNEAEALTELQAIIGIEIELKATPLREVSAAKNTAGRKAIAAHLPRVAIIHDTGAAAYPQKVRLPGVRGMR